jgi:hypothetical protein
VIHVHLVDYMANRQLKPKDGFKKLVTGFRPIVHARQGLMLGIRQPLDGPIFQTLEHAENWCMDVMANHYDRRLGLSDARIEPFKGLVNCFPEASYQAGKREIGNFR